MSLEEPKFVFKKGAQHDDWGTPREVLDVVFDTVGAIDLDLASNAAANKLVGAKRYYSKAKPCPISPPHLVHEVVYCNPPGAVKNVRWFFDVWQYCIGSESEGAFLIFQIDHWRTLTKHIPRPLYCLLWPKRIRYVGAQSTASFSSVLILTRPPENCGNVVVW